MSEETGEPKRYCELPVCGKELVRKKGESPDDFERRRFCGRSCSSSRPRFVIPKNLTKEKLQELEDKCINDDVIAEMFGISANRVGFCRKLFGVSANRRGPGKTKTSGKRGEEFIKIGNQMTRAFFERRRAERVPATSFETVESFLARGGQITRCDSGSAMGVSVGQAHVVPPSSGRMFRTVGVRS